MEDNLKKLEDDFKKNGRRPQKMEDDIKHNLKNQP